jgi:CDP-glucose 4,6-dehydratase
MAGPNPNVWRDASVLVTGETGFVGGWLSEALIARGAQVHGFAATPPAAMSVAAALAGQPGYHPRQGDIRNLDALNTAMAVVRPSVIFHLAAQPLVRPAFRDPLETFAINAMGTASLLEAARGARGLRAIVVFTSDKVYLNRERVDGYRESDPIGDDEPYGASKGAAELAIAAWRKRYLAAQGVGVASLRAGNIIGGGDWAGERLVPDAIRKFSAGEPLVLRYPHAVRPWQHVLDAVDGTLRLAERLIAAPETHARAWNFGPERRDCLTVGELAGLLASNWGDQARCIEQPENAIPEAGLLFLDSAAARRELGWRSTWDIKTAVARSVAWYRAALAGGDPLLLAREDARAHRNARLERAA